MRTSANITMGLYQHSPDRAAATSRRRPGLVLRTGAAAYQQARHPPSRRHGGGDHHHEVVGARRCASRCRRRSIQADDRRRLRSRSTMSTGFTATAMGNGPTLRCAAMSRLARLCTLTELVRADCDPQQAPGRAVARPVVRLEERIAELAAGRIWIGVRSDLDGNRSWRCSFYSSEARKVGQAWR